MTQIATPTAVSVYGLTFLQMVQRLWRDCRMSGSVPTSCQNQTGDRLDFVNAVATAWEQIQLEHKDWLFLRRSTSFVTVDGQAIYTKPQAGVTAGFFGRWLPKTFRSYLTSVGTTGEIPLGVIEDYDSWRDTYLLGGNRNVRSQPTVVCVTPEKSIALGPVPAVGYTVTGDYYLTAELLTNDDQIPILPENSSSMVIVYRAMMLYGEGNNHPEHFNLGQRNYLPLINALKTDQLPRVCFA